MLTSVHTAWDFNAEFDSPAGVMVPVPAVDLRHDVSVSLTNGVRAGRPYLATFTPSYQPGYTAPQERFTVQAWVSHDDGATWRSAGTRYTWQKGQGAQFLLPAPPKNATFVTVRIKATDGAGNSIDQTLTRAWKVEKPSGLPRHGLLP